MHINSLLCCLQDNDFSVHLLKRDLITHSPEILFDSQMQLICSDGQTIQKGEKFSHVQKLHLKAIKPDVF